MALFQNCPDTLIKSTVLGRRRLLTGRLGLRALVDFECRLPVVLKLTVGLLLVLVASGFLIQRLFGLIERRLMTGRRLGRHFNLSSCLLLGRA